MPSGNRNLFKGSRDFSGTNWINNNSSLYTEDYQGVKIFKKQSMWGGFSQYFEAKTGEEYVFSAYVKSSAKSDNVTFFLIHTSKQPTATGNVGFDSTNSRDLVSVDITDEYKRIAIKIKITKDGWIMPRLERYNTDAYLFFGGYKFEKGSESTPYSQAPEDLGWSTDALVPTQSQRYLWKFEYVYYSDGSVEVTQPVNLSIAGADGTNGQTSHVHFAFADNATGGGFSLTTPKAYMGWYADFNESASNDPTKYKWGKWKGDQGVQGDKGDDGKTSYLHLAYASSANGKTGFSFTDTKQQYQGYYTDFTQTSSTDPTKYTWMDRRAGVEVGGVNLLHNSKGPFKPNKDNPYKHDNYIVYPKVTAYLEEGKQYIVTAKTDGVFSNNHVNVESDNILLWMVKQNGSVNQIISDTKTGEAGTVFVWNHPTGEYCLRVNAYHDEPDKSAWEVKIEEGNIKTTYTRNPEDVQSDIDSKADQALTQQQLNALAEKNRNMEAEMAAKASLAEVERWKQAYDEYVAQNDADKTSAEQKLITLTSRVAEWVKDWEDKKVQWSFLDTNMDFGEEGLRLGKKGSPTSILISNDRIGFYSGGSEVASMSNGTLTIDNGIFAKSLQIGHYREEVYEGDKTINVIRWID
ncbi:TPA: hypothetical protein ACHRY8_000900 [Streptococcus pyogenes]